MQPKVQRQLPHGNTPPSLRHQAYAKIKRRLNRLEYCPGAYLNEAQISRQLKIGRTPVHQALGRLMLEGLVQVIPRKGVMVQTVSLDQVLKILEARLVNEPYCASLAAERATSQEITGMQELFGSATVIRESLINLDRAFHRLISDAARNSVAADILIMLHERSLRFWFIAFADDLQLRRIVEEHRAILSAIKQRNRAETEAAMRAHIESSRNHIIRPI